MSKLKPNNHGAWDTNSYSRTAKLLTPLTPSCCMTDIHFLGTTSFVTVFSTYELALAQGLLGLADNAHPANSSGSTKYSKGFKTASLTGSRSIQHMLFTVMEVWSKSSTERITSLTNSVSLGLMKHAIFSVLRALSTSPSRSSSLRPAGLETQSASVLHYGTHLPRSLDSMPFLRLSKARWRARIIPRASRKQMMHRDGCCSS